jgi:hypothetical protein
VGLWGSFCGFALGSFLYSSFFSFSFFNKTPYYLLKKKKKKKKRDKVVSSMRVGKVM